MSAPPPLHKRLRRIRRTWTGAALAVFMPAMLIGLSTGLEDAAIGLAGAILIRLAGALHVAGIRRALQPADPDAELLRGMRLLLANDRFAAETVFREILARNPADVEATLYLGLVLREHGDLAGSARVLKRALRIDVARKWTGEIRGLLTSLDPVK